MAVMVVWILEKVGSPYFLKSVTGEFGRRQPLGSVMLYGICQEGFAVLACDESSDEH